MLCPESVLVTGANRGIGLEFVKQFLALPTPPKHVFAGCRNPEAAKDLKEIAEKNTSVVVLHLDLNDESSIKKSASAVQGVVGDRGLNLLINNAGIMLIDNLDTVTSENMYKSYATNAIGPLLIAQAFQTLLKTAAAASQQSPKLSINKAAIINISTGVASIAENDTGSMYSYRAAKAGLNMITKNLSLDLQKFGILATAIHPGLVDTDLAAPAKAKKMTTQDSVLSMFKVMEKCQGDDYTGKFYHYSGREMAW